jgi:hypothetical protein
LRTEETRNLNIPFGESSSFKPGRMSTNAGGDRSDLLGTQAQSALAGSRPSGRGHGPFNLAIDATQVLITTLG